MTFDSRNLSTHTIVAFLVVIMLPLVTWAQPPSSRVGGGLIGLYNFSDGSERLIQDC